MVVWFIGLSGAGKTTLATKLVSHLRESRKDVVFLDGDILRDVWGDDTDHTIQGREKNAKRISNLCKSLDQQGLNVVASVLSIFPEWQKWNRENFSQYFEIFLDVSMDILIERDTKGLYKKARKGEIKNVVGIDIEFPTPPSPDMILSDWSDDETPDKSIERIINSLPNIK
tara:strand:- start:40 stop:552 length:513 start_codon:yes stop_codon:yes gene_type:complete